MVPMPHPDVLYRLAKNAKDRAKLMDSPSMEDHLNHVGNVYLIANTQAERERRQETVFEITNRVCDKHEMPAKDYSYSNVLVRNARAGRRLNYTSTAVLITAALYFFVRILL